MDPIGASVAAVTAGTVLNSDQAESRQGARAGGERRFS